MNKINEGEEFQLANIIFTYSVKGKNISLHRIKEAKEEPKQKKNKSFTPPELKAVKAYCEERKNDVDANKWYDFYQARGWMAGRNKMVDWKAAVRTWEKPKSAEAKPEFKFVM